MDLRYRGLVSRVIRSGAKIATTVIKHRGVDVQVELNRTTRHNMGAALLHSTGSAMFNAELRMFAKQRGFILNQYGLTNKLSNKVVSRTEEAIFKALGLDFIPPEDRNDGFWLIVDEYKNGGYSDKLWPEF